MIGRIAVTEVSPVVSGGQWPAKVVVGEAFPVDATVFRDGHGAVGATAVLTPATTPVPAPVAPVTPAPVTPAAAAAPATPSSAAELSPVRVPMRLTQAGLDRWQAQVQLPAEGLWLLTVEGWADPISTWRAGITAKIAADQSVELECEEGAQLFTRAAAERIVGAPRGRSAALKRLASTLRDHELSAAARVAATEEPSVLALLSAAPLRDLLSLSEPTPILVERPRALIGSWYEMFPRSEGGLRLAADRLPAIAGMGFDVVYLPPVHPIGISFRKGPNNSLDPGPTDPGSPWAIGSADGGHDAIDPGLGDEQDFRFFVEQAARHGIEVAIDLALQASPDHPWATSHPDWFSHRADGTIAYAENPPKKYQDIYPLDFDRDPAGLHAEVLRIALHWMSLGVRIFRVDNPHTKPVSFWAALIADIQRIDPGVVFLAEAFTRPPMMHLLAQVGFTQSYTYFTWRNSRSELEEYLTDLTTGPTADYMRPNLFVNTPDILSAYLQYGGPAAFRIRAVLAATLSPSWGVYSGYELYEHEAVAAGSEEYLDSEKYQLRTRDWSQAEERLAPYLRRLNAARRAHPALQRLRGLTFHDADNQEIIAYSRTVEGDTVLTVVNLDPHSTQEATLSLNLPALGRDWSDRFLVVDQLGDGASYEWGAHNYVRLDPFVEPAHLFVLPATPTP